MKKLKLIVLTTCLLISLCLNLSACGSEKTLKIGVNDSYRPFGYTENGKQKGFEIDLWQAIAKKAKIRYQLQPMNSAEILSKLGQRHLDAGIAGITVKEGRKKSVDFSTSYLHTGQRLAVRKNDTKTGGIADMRDKVIATKLGTTGYEYASRVQGVKKIIAFSNFEDALKSLENGEADALIYDKPGVEFYSNLAPLARNIRPVGDKLTEEHYAIAFPKGSRQLGRVNNALRELVKTGEFERIYMKWFGQKPESLPGEKK